MNKNSLKNLTYNHVPNSEDKVRDYFATYNIKILNYTYKNTNTKMLCEDNKGYRFFASMTSVSVNKTHQIFSVICNECNFMYNVHLYEIENKIPSHIVEYYSSNIKGHVKVKCVCECGNIFECDFNAWRRMDKVRCNTCTSKLSNIAYKTKLWLDENNIEYIMEYKFLDCKNKRPLPFDFYLPDYNICIEVDGEQHYYVKSMEYVEHKRFTQGDFENIKINDNIKTKYCESNNIKLIRLKYSLFRNNGNPSENYKKVLKNEIYNN